MVKIIKSNSNFAVTLHPLVVLNISDHHTRETVNGYENKEQRVFGCLFGTQEGRLIDIKTSFDIPHIVEDKKITIDMDYIKTKVNQCKNFLKSR
jgi:COP9 signalosome complex subunit 6